MGKLLYGILPVSLQAHIMQPSDDGHANGIIKQPAQSLAAMSVSDPAAAFFPSPLALTVSPSSPDGGSRPTMDNILFSIEKSG